MLIWPQSYSQWFSVHLAAVNGAGFLLMCNGNHTLEKTAGESSAKVFFVMVLPGGIPGYLVGMSLFRYRTLSRHFCWGLSLILIFPMCITVWIVRRMNWLC